MKAKIIKTIDYDTLEEYLGIAFQTKKGSKYCKYILGSLTIKSRTEAKNKLIELQKKLDNLTVSQIDFINSYPSNKIQFVNLPL